MLSSVRGEDLYALICEVVAVEAGAWPALRRLPGCFFATQPAIILACCVRLKGAELNQWLDLKQKMPGREFVES
jgi:hypothetical protein